MRARGLFVAIIVTLATALAAGLAGCVARAQGGAARRDGHANLYAFVARSDRHYGLRSLDDPVLRTLRIGVQLIGDDYASSPPVEALARRGLAERVVGFSVYGDDAEPNPPARIVDAVVSGTVDVAIVWGPLAGYFAKRTAVPLDITPVTADPPEPPSGFQMAMGVSTLPLEASEPSPPHR